MSKLKKYKIALIIGRFQPFHKGHLYLVKKALEEADKIVFGIGSANIHDEYNPLNYDQRKKMLEIVIKEEDIEDRVKGIVPLDDFYNDEKWLNNVKKQVDNIDIVIGNSEWVNKILEKAGYRIWRLGYYKKFIFEGWRVRKLISKGKDFKSRIPTYLYPFLISNFSSFAKASPFAEASRDKSADKQISNFKYMHAIIGGTFDHFHIGHEKFIEAAIKRSSRITIGLTTENFFQNKLLFKFIEDYKTREKNLTSFLKRKNFFDRATIISLYDIYGSGNKEEKIDAIFVTKETYPGAVKINQTRKDRGWPLLKVITVPFVKDENNKKISSERIRLGEIDRQGHVYNNFFKNKKQLILPDSLRNELREPIGLVTPSFGTSEVTKLIRTIQNAVMTISVGDIISIELMKAGIEPDIKIIDFKTRRKALISNDKSLFEKTQGRQTTNHKLLTDNRAGTINPKACVLIKKSIDSNLRTGKTHTIVVNGEEDLLTIPAILLAPLNALVLYGQYGLGAVVVKINEKIKKKAEKILLKFV